MEKTVIELFAGVGGFRVGLNNLNSENEIIKNPDNYKFIWANQWEPATKSQEAFECYKCHFGKEDNELTNIDIALVNKKEIPDHTLLTGGFPCQDYSVAHTLASEKGIEGKKGVLWWQIYEILLKKKPPFVLLENVDRLLKSPSKQRGRDFGIILKSFDIAGYMVQWKVVNAADYGMPQRRRRVYIFASRKNTNYFKEFNKKKPLSILNDLSIFAKTFKSQKINEYEEFNLKIYKDQVEVSNNFKAGFQNFGYMRNGKIYTSKYIPIYKEPITLRQIIESNVDKKYYLTKKEIKKFEYLRGSKKIKRTRNDGSIYFYSEGAMSSFDSLDLPGRTMLTSEGTTNRSTHIILDPTTNKLRRLTPIECERLNQFPDNWTKGMNDRKRYFMMGNALVTGIISILGKEISKIIDNED